jgi:CRP/FNR family transcriptional regulator
MGIAMAGKVDVLKSVPLFDGLSKSELKHVAKDAAREELFSPGQVLVQQGTKGGTFFVIVEGRAKVVRDGKTMRTLGPGSYFGEMALLDGGPRSASIIAETRVKALGIAPWNFLAMLEENFSMTRKILAELSLRVRTLERSVKESVLH